MKKQKILSLIIVIAICLSLSVGLSYLTAGSWNEPATVSDSREVPVNATANNQAKVSGLSVTSLLVNREAEFHQRVFFRGNVNGGAPGAIAPTLKIGGDDGTTEYNVITNVKGDVKAVQELGSDELVAPELQRLCSDDTGHVVFCPNNPLIFNPDGQYDASPTAGVTGICEVEFQAHRSLPAVADSNTRNVNVRVVFDIWMDNDYHRTGTAEFMPGEEYTEFIYDDPNASNYWGSQACSSVGGSTLQLYEEF